MGRDRVEQSTRGQRCRCSFLAANKIWRRRYCLLIAPSHGVTPLQAWPLVRQEEDGSTPGADHWASDEQQESASLEQVGRCDWYVLLPSLCTRRLTYTAAYPSTAPLASALCAPHPAAMTTHKAGPAWLRCQGGLLQAPRSARGCGWRKACAFGATAPLARHGTRGGSTSQSGARSSVSSGTGQTSIFQR